VNLALLLPAGLTALFALALPILIHLVRHSEQRVTAFAALRWLYGPARPRRRLRVEQWWLLLLRLLLIAALALLLAQPVWVGRWRESKPWVVLAPGVDPAAAHAMLPNTDASWHWLAGEFPSVDKVPSAVNAPIASLLRELDAQLPADLALTVMLPQEVGGLDGERPLLNRAVDWRVMGGRMAQVAAPSDDHPIVVAVRYTPDRESSIAFIRAAVAAWNVGEPGRYVLDSAPIGTAIGVDVRWLIALSPDLPAEIAGWIEHGGTALVERRSASVATPVWRNESGKVLARTSANGNGRLIELAPALTTQDLPELLDGTFPQRLVELFRPPPAPTRALAAMAKPLQGMVDAAPARQALDEQLALLIAILFLAERVVAARSRKQPAA
jgi:Aerotolerance regulator N-terminal